MFAHIDMNSYFASVEQQANPHLRGRPLGVCTYLHKVGCVIAASIEAKQCGVKVGMSMEEAKRVCPQMKFVQNDPPKYRAVTSKIFALFHEMTDKVEHYSIDEAFLDLTGWYRDEAEAAWALCRARLRIQKEIGEWLRCSIGIAPSKFLSKLASEMHKPNGLTIINQDNLDACLATRELEDACGIGKRIHRHLNKLGIYTLLDLKNYPVGNLIRALGVQGYYWHERLHGREIDRFQNSTSSVVPCALYDHVPKTIGHSFCVPRRANDQNLILPILIRLTERAGRRLRSFNHYTRALNIRVSLGNDVEFRTRDSRSQNDISWGVGRVMTVKFAEPVNDPFSLIHAACRALEQMWQGEPVIFLAVTLLDFVPPNGQLRATFPPSPSRRRRACLRTNDDLRELEKYERTTHAIDTIRDRHGHESIIFASMLGLSSDYAPDRIGFRKTEGVEL